MKYELEPSDVSLCSRIIKFLLLHGENGGGQKSLQPFFAQSDQIYISNEVLYSGALAATRSGNERPTCKTDYFRFRSTVQIFRRNTSEVLDSFQCGLYIGVALHVFGSISGNHVLNGFRLLIHLRHCFRVFNLVGHQSFRSWYLAPRSPN